MVTLKASGGCDLATLPSEPYRAHLPSVPLRGDLVLCLCCEAVLV